MWHKLCKSKAAVLVEHVNIKLEFSQIWSGAGGEEGTQRKGSNAHNSEIRTIIRTLQNPPEILAHLIPPMWPTRGRQQVRSQ